ncbi:hypothetical protein JE959_000125 [Aeromonas veronii]|nr:hypothetical protein [Aeromonas veronii]
MLSVNIIMLVYFAIMCVRKMNDPVYGRIYRNGVITYTLCLLGTFILSIVVNWPISRGYVTTPDDFYKIEIFKTIGLVSIIVANVAPIIILVRQKHKDMMDAINRLKEKNSGRKM